MTHPTEGTLQAYLDGEVQSEPREAVDRHLDGCSRCRGTLVELNRMSEETSLALEELDARAPERERVLWEVRRARAAGRSRRYHGRVVAAASVVLLLAAGWAVAMPGSPVRGWFQGPLPLEVDGPGLAGSEAASVSRVTVSQEMLDGGVLVFIDGAAPGSLIDARIVDAEEVRLNVPAGAVLESGPGRVRADLNGLETDLWVEIPESAFSAELSVDGLLLLRKSASDITYPGPDPVPTDDGSIRFLVEDPS